MAEYPKSKSMGGCYHKKGHSVEQLNSAPGDVVYADVALGCLLVAGWAAPVAAAALQPTLDARVTEKVAAPGRQGWHSALSSVIWLKGCY